MQPDGGHPDSYYVSSAIGLESQPRLEGEARADICVIGAGYTGLSAALHLAERGYEVVVLEAKRIGWGASGRNGGQVGSGQRKDQEALEARYGKTIAHQLWDIAEDAKATVKSLIERHQIPCDLKPGILHVAHKPALVPWCFAMAEKLARDYGYDAVTPLRREELADHIGSEVYHGGWLDEGAAHLHPLNFALGLARAAQALGVRIYERSRAHSYDRAAPATVRTLSGQVKADYVVLAGNAYLEGLEPWIAGHIMPIHNYIIATEPLGEARAHALIPNDVAVADTKFIIDYFRLSADKRLLFGGGESYRRQLRRDIIDFVRPVMLRVFPQLKGTRIDYGWGGTLAVTVKRMPHFGRLAPHILFAHGYSGHGVAMATMAGKLIAEAVAGTAERFDVLSALPTPRFPGGTLLRAPGFILGMLYYGLKDRL
ncbi:MAG: NAD(P)/FAD-dependent oxidoreductase [Pseudomonadota bacterium]